MTPPRTVDRALATPLWAQLHAILRSRVNRGDYALRFPTDKELVDEFGVARATVRDAVRRLMDEGLLERTAGRGTFVRQHSRPVGTLVELLRVLDDAPAMVRNVERVQHDDAAVRLGARRGATLLHVERVLQSPDGESIGVDHTWFAPPFVKRLVPADFSMQAPDAALLERCGVAVDEASESISASVADPVVCELLEHASPCAVLELRQVAWSAGAAVLYRCVQVRGDRLGLSARWRSGQANPTLNVAPISGSTPASILESAERAHLEWRTRFLHALAHQQLLLSAAEVTADDRCALGRWLHGAGADRFAGDAAYPCVLEAHASFHRSAGAAVALASGEQHQQAMAALAEGGEVAAASQQLVSQLRAWRLVISG